MIPRLGAALLCTVVAIQTVIAQPDDLRVLIEGGDLAAALEISDVAMAQPSPSATDWRWRGEVLLELQRLGDAEAAFTQAAAADTQFRQRLEEVSARLAFFRGQDLPEAPRKLIRKLTWLDAPPGMRRTKSKHYRIFVEEEVADLGGTKVIAQTLERAHKVYRKVFAAANEKQASRVYALGSDTAWSAFLTQIDSRAMAYAAGFYSPELRILVVRTRRPGTPPAGVSDEARHGIAHEAFHQFMGRQLPVRSIPVWYTEGLAEHFAYVLDAGKPGLLLRTAPAFQGLLRYARTNTTTPLARLMTLGYERFHDRQRQGLHYAQAWTFVEFLLRGRAGKSVVKTLHARLRAGEPGASAQAKAFRNVDVAKLEARWKEYVLGAKQKR